MKNLLLANVIIFVCFASIGLTISVKAFKDNAPSPPGFAILVMLVSLTFIVANIQFMTFS